MGLSYSFHDKYPGHRDPDRKRGAGTTWPAKDVVQGRDSPAASRRDLLSAHASRGRSTRDAHARHLRRDHRRVDTAAFAHGFGRPHRTRGGHGHPYPDPGRCPIRLQQRHHLVDSGVVLHRPGLPRYRSGGAHRVAVRCTARSLQLGPAIWDGFNRPRSRATDCLDLSPLQVNVATAPMFVTAMAASPLAVAAAAKLGVDISWSKWALAASVPGLASLIAVPWVMSKIYPPTVTRTPQAPAHAR